MGGCIHIYCGDGKGKTSAAVGISVRAAGRGRRVLFVRFLKTEDSGEVPALRGIPGIDVTYCDKEFGFVSRMKPEEKTSAAKYFQARFEDACAAAREGGYDVLVLDEIMAACNTGMVREKSVLDFLTGRPEGLEVILTGRDPSQELLSVADYVSEIRMVRHPFTRGLAAREGIEY